MKCLHQSPREQPIRPSASRLPGGLFMRAERIPAFSMAQRCGSTLSRLIRVSPRAFRRWASSLCRDGSSRWFPSGTQSLELRNRRDSYAWRRWWRYRRYLLSVSDPTRVDQCTVQRA